MSNRGSKHYVYLSFFIESYELGHLLLWVLRVCVLKRKERYFHCCNTNDELERFNAILNTFQNQKTTTHNWLKPQGGASYKYTMQKLSAIFDPSCCLIANEANILF